MIDAGVKHLILTVAVWTLVGSGGLAVVWWAVFTRGKARRCCPGVRGGRWAWLWPANWVKGSSCGYDLTSLPEVDGLTRCPECGSQCRVGERRASGARISALRLGVVLLAVGLTLPAGRWVKNHHWAGHLPNWALLSVREGMGTWTPRGVRREISNRLASFDHGTLAADGVMHTTMSESQQEWAARLYIADLRDDGVAWNEATARWVLSNLPREVTLPLLEKALGSDDYQQRQVAADILRWRADYREPSDAMLRVCVEGLKHDRLERADVYNAAAGWKYLVEHPKRTEPLLEEGLGDKDAQGRFMCAVVVCAAGLEGLAEKAVPVLIEALGDNTIYDDATMATAALVKMGRPALPYLRAVGKDGDDQRWIMAAMIIRRIEHPEAPPIDMGPHDAARINSMALDPTQVKLPLDGIPGFPSVPAAGVGGP